MGSERAERGTPNKALKDYQAIFRKYISIGEDSEENYDMIDIQIEAQKAVRRITDRLEIVKQYPKVVRAYNNFEQDFPGQADEAYSKIIIGLEIC